MKVVADRFAEHKERVRQAIVDAALACFEEAGFEATTVDQIATAAGVAPRTFFRYFPTKDAALFPDKDERMLDLRAALAERPRDEPLLASLREVVLSLVMHVADRADVWRRRHDIVRSTPSLLGRELEMHREFADQITEFASTRLGVDPDADVRPRLIANTLIGALTAALETWAAGEMRGDLQAMIEQALGVLANGYGELSAQR